MNKLGSYLLIFILLIGCGEYPRDPEDTLNKIKESKILKIAVIHNPPFTDINNSPPTGKEIDIINKFALSIGVKPEWHITSIKEALDELEAGEAHIAIGGLVESDPYKKRVGYTRPYDIYYDKKGEKNKLVPAIRKGENKFLTELEKFLKNEGLDASGK